VPDLPFAGDWVDGYLFLLEFGDFKLGSAGESLLDFDIIFLRLISFVVLVILHFKVIFCQLLTISIYLSS